MSIFTSKLILWPLSGGKKWQLVETFGFWTGQSVGQGEYIEVPAGFVTDFATVPRVFWFVIPPWGRYGKAAVLHDYLYAQQRSSRKRCDRIFKHAMKILSVPRWKVFLIYNSVKLFGWISYNKKGKQL